MAVARPDAPAKLAALRRLADNEPGAQEIGVGDSNHLRRHGLVDVDRLPDGRRQHTVTPAGWALLGEHAAPDAVLRSVNPTRPGHGIAAGDVVAYADGRTLSGAWRMRHALVTGFDDTDPAGTAVLLDTPGRPEPVRRLLAAVSRVDPPVAWHREDLEDLAEPGRLPAGPPAQRDGSAERDRAPRTVVFQGRAWELAPASVATRMRGRAPERISKYYVEVNGHAYPVKQVARACTGVHEQNTRESQKLLRDLGYTVHQTS